MAVLAFLLGLTLFAWTATGLAGLFAHGAWPDHVTFGNTPEAVRGLITEPHNLADAWPKTPRAQLSGYGLFWGIFLSQLMVLMVLTVFVMGTVARARAVRRARRLRGRYEREYGREEPEEPPRGGDRPSDGPGPGTATDGATSLAQGAPVEQHPAPEQRPPGTPDGAWHTSGETQPGTAPPAAPGPNTGAHGDGTAAGAGAGTNAGAGAGPGMTGGLAPAGLAPGAFGTRRTGNGGQDGGTSEPAGGDGQDLVAQVLEAPGAVLVASTTPALWAATKTARAKLGPVHLFDPTHACDTPDRLRWSPHHACADRATAASRATALLAPLRSPRPIDATTHTAAETMLRCWLHAAALEKKPFREVHRWALAASPSSDPVRILRSHPKSTSGAGGELESVLAGHPQLRADAVALVRRALAPLGQLHVRNACSAERADRLALESFIDEAGTLYVVGEDPEVLPLLNALTQSVVEHGRRMAVRSSAGRLDPPLTTVLRLDAPT
ncbi:hypothetical protein [Streptomyces sp. NBC_01795]|uniref:hypothetical protein n=1 Tax=Streptomyces sp. NBC_01795 TaxID=2975943 RepID=UPI003FA3B999